MLEADIELMPGEKMILASNPHWFYFWKQVAAGVIIVAVMYLALRLDDDSWANTPLRWLIIVAVVLFNVDLVYELSST